MSTLLWTTPSAWAAIFTTSGNQASFASGNSVISDNAVTNTNGDTYADISSISAMTPAAPFVLAFFVLPLNQDGTTYGDNQIGTTAVAKTPPATLYGSEFQAPAVSSAAFTGYCPRIWLPPKGVQYVFGMQNLLGANLPSSGNMFKYFTYDLSAV